MKIEIHEVAKLSKEEYDAYCTTMRILADIHNTTHDGALSLLTMKLWGELDDFDDKYLIHEAKEVDYDDDVILPF